MTLMAASPEEVETAAMVSVTMWGVSRGEG